MVFAPFSKGMIWFVSGAKFTLPVLVSLFYHVGNFVFEFSDAPFLSLGCFVLEIFPCIIFKHCVIFFSSLRCLLFSEFSGHPTRTFKQNTSNVVSCVPRSFCAL